MAKILRLFLSCSRTQGPLTRFHVINGRAIRHIGEPGFTLEIHIWTIKPKKPHSVDFR